MTDSPADRLRAALAAGSSAQRLQAALAAGTYPDPLFVPVLIEQCAVEPDFSVRDTLTWALVRHSASEVLAPLLREVADGGPQAQSQALHTLSKVGDSRGWPAITPELLRSANDDIARTAWRAAVVMVPDEERVALAEQLSSQLGLGDRTRRASLSRAFVTLGEAAAPALARARQHPELATREHAIATALMVDDADLRFEEALLEAKVLALSESIDRACS